MKPIRTALAAGLASALLLSAVPASALVITADYSNLGAVYQNAGGFLSNANSGNDANVTDAFKANFQTAITYWQNAVLIPNWSTTFNVTLANLSASSAVGDNTNQNQVDANARPNANLLRVDSGNVAFFVDTTPENNSEFTLADYTVTNGTGNPLINSGRYGAANVGSGAESRFDLLSLFLHEMEHGLGISDNLTRWGNVVSGTIMTVSTAVSGLVSPFQIPVTNSHIDGSAQNGDFNQTSIALPGWPSGYRALLSGVDILAVCAVAGCTPNQMDLNPALVNDVSTVPEPGSLALLSIAGLALWGSRRRKPA